MKRVKKLAAISFSIVISALSTATVVHADTVPYDWEFRSTRPTEYGTPGFKDDSEQNYYITISSGNVSGTNVFGASIRRLNDNFYMASYRLHKSLKYSVPYAYDQGRYANMEEPYQVRGKKDDSSTSSAYLYAAGKVTY